MYDKNIEFKEKVTRLIDENDVELKKVNALLDFALDKLEISREELEHELLKDIEEEQKLNELIKEMVDEYENLECTGKSCLICEYGGSASCDVKFAIKRLIEKGMLKI